MRLNGRAKPEQPAAPRIADIEEALRDALKTKVQVTYGRNKGKLVIEFYSKDDLERLVEILCGAS